MAKTRAGRLAAPHTPSDRPGLALTRQLSGTRIAHLFTLLALLAWWLYSQTVPAYQMPGPGAVFLRMVDFVTTPFLLSQLWISIYHISLAIGLAFLVGSALAFFARFVPVTRMLIDTVLTPFLNAFAGIGWLFLALLWFGLNHTTVIFAVTMILIPLTTINVRAGLQELDEDMMEMGLSFSRSGRRRFLRIVLPLLVPYFFAALRISFGVSWKVVLTAELFGGNAGLGYLLNVARQEFDTETIFAIIAFILVFVVICEQLLFRPVQRRLDRRYARA
jgi:ABC-type nitrate/sulfonate/bicarbonate transport system permease component